ncbi:biotin synthase BioB [Salicibibacter halophilus]|uniref:Biotin synthase n=1 Tax=Salicibibacter halophilus TaxID=2502791 RepID=A0A514LG66_9BACI|nr:biotin synthase BioB [Salicibibacter halophilus]QDI90833.1 biotin synthase BioB [Salicibibacter halophilus]
MTDTITPTKWEILADKALQGKRLTLEEGLSLLQADDDEMLPIMQAAYRVRKHYYGKKVKLNMIFNAKSGNCPEDCGYCAQSIVSSAPIEKYRLLDKETLVAGAHEAIERQAGTYCIVASGRRPSNREVDQVVAAVEEITATTDLKICACLGLLDEGKATQLQKAGVHRYNHNLNTHKDNHANITTTHTYDDRVDTLDHVKNAGISPCSGCIVGMGETDGQLVETAYALRDMDVDSIPVNFLHAIPGTPLEDYPRTKPMKSLKVLAMMRLINPSKEIRISGGREINLRHLQPIGLYAANSVFVGDYLTTEGQAIKEDHAIIEDLGFEIEECAL